MSATALVLHTYTHLGEPRPGKARANRILPTYIAKHNQSPLQAFASYQSPLAVLVAPGFRVATRRLISVALSAGPTGG
jgi:hypothetical protein